LGLESLFEEVEFFKVVKGMNIDKAPRSNGFFMALFQACGDVLKADILGAFHEFHTSSNFEKSLNATFIALIPKKSGATDLKDFWPISLVWKRNVMVMGWCYMCKHCGESIDHLLLHCDVVTELFFLIK
jgi:hypothetical protein